MVESGSHLWGDGRLGSASQFFNSNVKKLLYSAAEREGLDPGSLEIVSMAGLKAGSLSIHNGRIWHGSGKNESKTKPRRGLGMHFVPKNVRFTMEASKSSLWKSYVADVEDPSTIELSEEDFPIVTTSTSTSTLSTTTTTSQANNADVGETTNSKITQ